MCIKEIVFAVEEIVVAVETIVIIVEVTVEYSCRHRRDSCRCLGGNHSLHGEDHYQYDRHLGKIDDDSCCLNCGDTRRPRKDSRSSSLRGLLLLSKRYSPCCNNSLCCWQNYIDAVEEIVLAEEIVIAVSATVVTVDTMLSFSTRTLLSLMR